MAVAKINPSELLRKPENRDILEMIESDRPNVKAITLKGKTIKCDGPVAGSFSKFIINNYGCEKCQLKDYCEDYPHANKICAKRSTLFVEYGQACRGDTIPLMKYHLMRLEIEKEMEEARWRSQGVSPSQAWLKMNDQISKILEIINKCEEGIKIHHEISHFDELAKEVQEERKKKQIIKMDNGGIIEVTQTE